MSNSDTFIDEVTEEVRRDRLFYYIRRYGWIAVVLVVALVGAAAFWEWQKAQDRARAEALGDTLLAALEAPDAEARTAALAEVDPEGDATVLLDFLAAQQALAAGDRAAAAEALAPVATSSDTDPLYRDLAALAKVIAERDTTPVEDRLAALEPLVAAGAPFRLLAQEQKALLLAETGDTEAAISELQSILDDTETTAALQRRAVQLMLALGGNPAAG